MRILGQMVVRNEAERYLACCLAWHVGILDDLHVFDDRSIDGTAELARDLGAHVTVRGTDEASFLEHEGRFREAGWRAFEETLKPEPGDWVLAVDADEFLVAAGDEQGQLDAVARDAEAHGAVAALVPIPEVFGVSENESGYLSEPLVRTDGYWGRIVGSRFFAYRPGGTFADRPMGSGSEPTYVAGGPFLDAQLRLWLMHYGYADPADQEDKFERYSERGGHADAHVASIVTEATLVRWSGPSIDIYRGQR